MTAYFERLDTNRYRPTGHTGGGWDPTELHFSPLGGLIAQAIEQHVAERPGETMLLSRLSFDILGRLDRDECELDVHTTRPGRTIALVEASAHIAGRPAVHARAWYLTAVDTASVAGGGPAPLPSPDNLSTWPMSETWPGGFVASLDVRPTRRLEAGNAAAWVSTTLDLIADERVSPVASFIALIDIANGLAGRQPGDQWMFPNLDLTVHLHRQPAGPWVGLDSTATFGPTGQGVTSTVLHDMTGPVGLANQALTVRPNVR